jgi:DNA-binding transcriptional MerR regulator
VAQELFLNPSDAARRLGVSTKALRLYEDRGLIRPTRTASGWRAYGPKDMALAAHIVSLRSLGLSIGQISRILSGEAQELETALAIHQGELEQRAGQIALAIARIENLRADLAAGRQITATGLADVDQRDLRPKLLHPAVQFALPWPWGGEAFELLDIKALTFIVGPLGSGKTRFANRLAEVLPNAAFIGSDRLSDGGAAAKERLAADAVLRSSVERAVAWLVDDGATASDALVALLVALLDEQPDYFVVDMIEQDLDARTQEALVAFLRSRRGKARPIFALTRSCAILDMTALGADEGVIFCPANHSPPMLVKPYPGTPGYEGVATCLASPEVRARTAGVIAWRPPAAQ